jgi:hypothetical protein
MREKVPKHRWVNRRKMVIFSIIFIFLAASTIIFLSNKILLSNKSIEPSGKIIYVATNESGDFNCDGIDDQVEINKALAYVAENPQYKTVYLRGPGRYVISDSILIGNNTALEGDPTAVIKLKDNASWKAEKPLITQMNLTGSHDITIKGFEINGNHNKNSELKRGLGYYDLFYFDNITKIQVHDMYLHDSHGDGLKVKRGSNIEFYNNRIYKLGHDALYAIYSSNVQAWNNKITCRTNSGLRVYNTNHIRFNNNVINSEGEGGAGIEIQNLNAAVVMDDIEICNNLLTQTNACGIWITGYGKQAKKYAAKDVYIHHNKFYKTGTNQGFDWGGGIVLNGFQNTLIENNLFDGCYGSAIAHKNVTAEFTAPSSGYTTIVKNNIIINTQPSLKAGKGYAIFNELNNTHSFILINNWLSNNTGGNYKNASSASDVKVYSGFAEQVSKNESLKKDFPWNEALSAGPQRPYQIEGITRLNHVSTNLIKILPFV